MVSDCFVLIYRILGHKSVFFTRSKIVFHFTTFYISGTEVVMDCKAPYDVITTPGITVISLNYPRYYPNNINCQITFTFDAKVAIEFKGLFDTEEHDVLEVRDGDSSDSPLISSISGRENDKNGKTIESTGRSMTLVFHSNISPVQYKGFKLIANEG